MLSKQNLPKRLIDRLIYRFTFLLAIPLFYISCSPDSESNPTIQSDAVQTICDNFIPGASKDQVLNLAGQNSYTILGETYNIISCETVNQNIKYSIKNIFIEDELSIVEISFMALDGDSQSKKISMYNQMVSVLTNLYGKCENEGYYKIFYSNGTFKGEYYGGSYSYDIAPYTQQLFSVWNVSNDMVIELYYDYFTIQPKSLASIQK